MHVDTCVSIFMCRVCTYGGVWQGLSSEAEKEKHPHKASAGVFLVEMLDPACVLSRRVRGWMRESRKEEREEATGRRRCRERGAREGRDSEQLGLFPSSSASEESPRAGRRVTAAPVRGAWS